MAVKIIGGGLAGVESAYQAAKRGVHVKLFEMRPDKMTPAHHSSYLAELVCSNSLRALSLENAAGLLKEEMKMLDSIIIRWAYRTRVPAGGALAVDREAFSAGITEEINKHPNIEVIHQEVDAISSEHPTVIATGPLTSDKLVSRIKILTGTEFLYFYDAAAPIVTYDSIDKEKVFWASRYGKGTPDYLNCPMTKKAYDAFFEALISGETVPLKAFEKQIVFEGCMPIEAMARRGKETLAFGPMKPVGLVDPRTGDTPYAVVQLRKDNQEGTLYNMVGFQTQLKWPEQRRIFRLIPGLEHAEFVRLGVMHRNTYINAPKLLAPTYQTKNNPNLLFAGQITGVEGYIESAASGIVAGINAYRQAVGKDSLVLPKETAIGALGSYITTASSEHFQPMNINFGLLPALPSKVPKKIKKQRLSDRALKVLEEFLIHI